MSTDHVNIRANDPHRTVVFYKTLGLELCGCLQLDGLYNLYMGAAGEPHTLEITVMADGGFATPGTGHFALAVGDLDAIVATMRAAGFEPERDPYHPGGREQWRICFFADPDGNRVELIDGDRMVTPNDPLPAGLP
jgi:catechol 2,3-dioxygenase-like lactoylglutathione lyase family enzyme